MHLLANAVVIYIFVSIYSSLSSSSPQTRAKNIKIIYQSWNPSTDNYQIKRVHMKNVDLQKEMKFFK